MHKKGKDGARVIRFVMEIAYVTQPDNERNSSDYILTHVLLHFANHKKLSRLAVLIELSL